METVLTPNDYDNSKPYHLEKWVDVNVPFGEIQATNQMHFMTRDEANEAKAKRQSNNTDVRRVIAESNDEPRRESIGSYMRRRNEITSGLHGNAGINQNTASSSSSVAPLKRQNDPLSFEDTPPAKKRRQNDDLVFT